MTSQEKLARNTRLLEETCNLENHEIMVGANLWHYQVFDGGYTMHDACFNPDIGYKATMEFQDRYDFDIYPTNGISPQRWFAAMGKAFIHINDQGTGLSVEDHALMDPSEYEEYLANPPAFQWKLFQRRCKEGMTLADIQNSVKECMAMFELDARIFAGINERGALNWVGECNYSLPIEQLFNSIRGIKGISMDMRRKKNELKSLLDYYYERDIAPTLENIQHLTRDGYTAEVGTCFLSPSAMNMKQLEELYFPYFDRIMEATLRYGKRMAVYSEASILRLAPFIKDYPKGSLVLLVESDDLAETRKALPNATLVGGMPSAAILYNGTKEQCIDCVKRSIDQAGPGLILASGKSLTMPNDAKRENLLAVIDYVRSVRI